MRSSVGRMPPERRRLVIDVDVAIVVRERVGAAAWLVLEALAMGPSAGEAVVEVVGSTRSVGASVGLSKDAVARALRCLAAAGLVERVDHRDRVTGRFVSTTYVVDLAAGGLSVTNVSRSTASVSKVTRVGTRDRPEEISDQLSFLD